ncbi:MAG: septal ring lytic transglycosylase RlpA family protein [Actinomycetota bacterium]|nr:septal ring lytic transglycosylase RlpA family protein [Actinomycetota bacterium]
MRSKTSVLLVVAMIASTGAAGAGTAPEPVVDDYPGVVDFRASFEIAVLVYNASPGQVVHLERRTPRTTKWVGLDKHQLDKSATFSFLLEDVRHTAFYRARVEKSPSESIRVAVRPRLTFTAKPKDIMKRGTTILRGLLRPVVEGRTVLLEQRVEGEWKPLGKAIVEDGRYSLRSRLSKSGFRRVRATFEGDELNARKRSRQIVRVHRPSLATWYGPGFFGNRTACGQRFTRRTIGIAHRRLPCGTKVHVLYQGATILLEVIDRGPYTDANWDLSQRAARKIGFYGKEDIGVLVRR